MLREMFHIAAPAADDRGCFSAEAPWCNHFRLDSDLAPHQVHV